MPAILCLETSSEFCSVALLYQGKVFARTSEVPRSHAEILTTLIERCLQDAEIGLEDVNALAISEGPGSYTGLRIGVSTAKGICFALGIPLISISTLKIIAESARREVKASTYWPMIDARRMEVYHCLYDDQLNLLSEVTNGIITDYGFMPAGVNKDTVACGDGSLKAREAFDVQFAYMALSAEYMTALAEESYRKNEFVDLPSFEPFYLKSANITSKE